MAEDQTKRGVDKEIQNIKNKDIEIKVSTSRKKQNPKKEGNTFRNSDNML